MSAFNKFRNGCSLKENWPAPVSHITYFIANCFEKGYAAATITTYIAGIGFYHKINGWTDPLNSFLIKKLLEGCRRLRPQADTRAPVTLGILEKILSVLASICYSHYETTLFKAVFVLAYYGLFRVSELVYTEKGGQPLTAKDLLVENDGRGLLVTIRASKTSRKPVIIRIPQERAPNSCPIQLISEYLKMRPQSSEILFVHSNGLPLTRYQFSAVLKKATMALSLSAGTFKTHSFRIGRATQLAIEGVSEDKIRVMGRWKSDAYKTYIRKTKS